MRSRNPSPGTRGDPSSEVGSSPHPAWRFPLWLLCLFVAVATTTAAFQETGGGPSPASEKVLADSENVIPVSGPQKRCGKFFVLETRQYGEFEVKQVHIAYKIPSSIAVVGLYYNDLKVIIDEAKATPVLLEHRENPELKNDTIKLSRAAYDVAKECLPPLDAGK